MANRTIVPFGPQHPVLPEPIHLDLVLEDEKVVEAIPSIGFVHRGLEELAGRRDFHDYQYVVERICGICSFKHGMAYCETLEQIFGAEVPKVLEANNCCKQIRLTMIIITFFLAYFQFCMER